MADGSHIENRLLAQRLTRHLEWRSRIALSCRQTTVICLHLLLYHYIRACYAEPREYRTAPKGFISTASSDQELFEETC